MEPCTTRRVRWTSLHLDRPKLVQQRVEVLHVASDRTLDRRLDLAQLQRPAAVLGDHRSDCVAEVVELELCVER